MDAVFGKRTIKEKKKTIRCSWCGERIHKGDPAVAWCCMDGRDFISVQVHPECSEAINRTLVEEGGVFDFGSGEQKRGKSWGEQDAT